MVLSNIFLHLIVQRVTICEGFVKAAEYYEPTEALSARGQLDIFSAGSEDNNTDIVEQLINC
jgi:hypothetical protein